MRDLCSESLIYVEFQGGFLVRLQTKKNHVINLKSVLRMVLIGLVFHAGSGHVKIVLQKVKNLMSVSKNLLRPGKLQVTTVRDSPQ